jgi:hypothetical protein
MNGHAAVSQIDLTNDEPVTNGAAKASAPRRKRPRQNLPAAPTIGAEGITAWSLTATASEAPPLLLRMKCFVEQLTGGKVYLALVLRLIDAADSGLRCHKLTLALDTKAMATCPRNTQMPAAWQEAAGSAAEVEVTPQVCA